MKIPQGIHAAEISELEAQLAHWQTVTDYARGKGVEDSGPGDLQALIEGLRAELAESKMKIDRLTRDLDALYAASQDSHDIGREINDRLTAELAELRQEQKTRCSGARESRKS